MTFPEVEELKNKNSFLNEMLEAVTKKVTVNQTTEQLFMANIIIQYNPKKCNAASIKLDLLPGTIQLFPKGILTILGVKTYKEAKRLVQKFLKIVKKTTLKNSCVKLFCVNACFYRKMPFFINLRKLVESGKIINFFYEPELCPIARYSIPATNTSLAICSNGMLYGVGFKPKKPYACHFKKIEKIIYNSKKSHFI